MKETIFYWPNGCGCRQSEFNSADYSHMSDDFGSIEVIDTLSDESIDRLVDALVS